MRRGQLAKNGKATLEGARAERRTKVRPPPLPATRAMSVRTLQQECAEHVTIRGTSVSLSFAAPSVMHVTVVHKFGLPNKHGIIPCDDHVLHLRFDHKNDALVYVWAAPVESESWNCLIM